MSAKPNRLERKVDYGLLSSYYGALLTLRQVSMLHLYCDEDLSLAEVAKQLGVTRQCVNDTLNRAFERLDELESLLGLMDRFDKQRNTMRTCRRLIDLSLQGIDFQDNLQSAARQLDDYLREEDN